MNTALMLALGIIGGRTDESVLLSIQRPALKAYWPMTELSGTTMVDNSGLGNNGTYSNVTLNSAPFADTRPTASFNGTTSKATIAAAMTMTGVKGACFIRGKVSGAGVWTDGTARYLMRLNRDASNEILIVKSTTNNRISVIYRVAGVAFTINITISTTDEFSIVVNYGDGSNGALLQTWLNGVSQGTATPAGTFAGDPIVNAFIGAGDAAPSNVWSGLLGRAALWDGVNLTSSEIDGLVQ